MVIKISQIDGKINIHQIDRDSVSGVQQVELISLDSNFFYIDQNKLHSKEKMLDAKRNIDKFEQKQLQNLSLANPVIRISENSAHLYSEYSGFYHLFYCKNTRGEIYISDSFSALHQYAETLTLQLQETLEYIQISTTLGDKTIFREINKFHPGYVYDLISLENKNISRREVIESTYEEVKHEISGYFDLLKDVQKPIYCDISGGYDTRTCTASLMKSNIYFNFVTNNRSQEISSDQKLAAQISGVLQIPMHTINIEPSKIDYSDITDYNNIDLIRGLDVSYRLNTEIKNKSLLGGLVVGGWGAENLRNQHGKLNSIESMAGGYGFNRLKTPVSTDYTEQIMEKIKMELEFLQVSYDPKSIGEVIHYFIKARHWAGSMLTVRNKYVDTLFPFYDPNIALKILGLDKSNVNYQKKLIDEFAPSLSDIPFGSSDTPLFDSKQQQLLYSLNKYKKKIMRKMGIRNEKQVQATDYPFPIKQFEDKISELDNFTGLSSKFLVQSNQSRNLPRYIGLCKIIEEQASKIRYAK